LVNLKIFLVGFTGRGWNTSFRIEDSIKTIKSNRMFSFRDIRNEKSGKKAFNLHIKNEFRI
jgi:hypothetical protein